MSTNADTTNEPSKDAELEAKKREADMAEAELRIQNALKAIALAKKEVQNASNADLLSAEQQKAKAQAEQAIAEAEKAKFNAGLPAVSTKPLDGKVELDDKSGYFSDILAFESAADGADKIAKKVAPHVVSGQNVYLVKQSDYLRGALLLKEVEQRLHTFDVMFDALDSRYSIASGNFVASTEAAPLLALSAIPAAVGALADVAALFRVDRSVKGRATTVTDEALIVEVAGSLPAAMKTKSNPDATVQVFRPSLNTQPAPAIFTALAATRAKSDKATLKLAMIRDYLAKLGVQIDTISAKVAVAQKELEIISANASEARKDVKEEIKRLKTLLETVPAEKTAERQRVIQAIAFQEKELGRLQTEEIAKRDPLVKSIETLNNSLEGPKSLKAQGEVAITLFEATIKAFAEFSSKLVSVPDGATNSPLTSLAETCVLRDLPEGSLILSVGVSGQGGEVETRRSIWTGGSVYHRAGTACAYTLFAKDGKVKSSGLVVSNRQAKEGKRINKN